MARKLPRLQRVLDAPALASVAYGEIASSIYFALGIIALRAEGFTPLVLLLVGGLFLVVALSYAEGTAALPETGGAATFVRRAANDLARLWLDTNSGNDPRELLASVLAKVEGGETTRDVRYARSLLAQLI